jgi:hypothetical protein
LERGIDFVHLLARDDDTDESKEEIVEENVLDEVIHIYMVFNKFYSKFEIRILKMRKLVIAKFRMQKVKKWLKGLLGLKHIGDISRLGTPFVEWLA